MNEKLARALGYVDEKYVAEAAKRKRRRPYLRIAVAAILTLAFLCNMPGIPLIVSARAVSRASEPRKMERPSIYSDKLDLWREEWVARNSVVDSAYMPIADFAARGSGEVLCGTDDVNRIWSPINAYIALAMTAELTAGETQTEVLNALGVSGLPQLRERISAVWEDIYQDNGHEISVLANSLWLDDEASYEQSVMDVLAYDYYASVYHGDLESDRMDRAVTNWLNNQTGGFLKDRTGKVDLYTDPTIKPLLAIASTVYFQSRWNDRFNVDQNTDGVFHSASGDVDCTFMNRKEGHMSYYWGEDFGAVSLYLENGATMWFFLPDEDKTVDDVLAAGEYMDAVIGHGEENSKWMKVNLSVPQFDVSSGMDLAEGLQRMGINRIFDRTGADFSPSLHSELPVFLSSVNQDTRVSIDEEGVTAATYILIEIGAGGAAPPEDIIDFVLDRPFVFAISYDRIPLFVGTVNTP